MPEAARNSSPIRRALALAPSLALLLGGCAGDAGSADPPSPQMRFMANLAHHCGQAFPGRLALEPPGDDMLTGSEELLVHFRHCEPDEVRIPFHVEIEDQVRWDRSRTWFLIRHPDRLELRHDHRRADGSEDARTWYGGFTTTEGTPFRQDFHSPERTEAAGVPVGWRIEIEPGLRYAYGTTHDGAYDWRVEFDLAAPIDASPPLPWGHDLAPTRQPGPP